MAKPTVITPTPADLIWKGGHSVPYILIDPQIKVDGRAHIELWVYIGDAQVVYDLIAHPPGRLTLVGLSLRANTSQLGGGLTATTLRRVRVGDYLRYLDRARRLPGSTKRDAAWREAGFGFLLDGAAPRALPPHGTRGRGRPRLSDLTLARTVDAYDQALRADSERPVQDAAERLGEKPERIRDLLDRARKRGMLEGSKSGVAGGTPTKIVRSLLRRKDQPAPAGRRKPR